MHDSRSNFNLSSFECDILALISPSRSETCSIEELKDKIFSSGTETSKLSILELSNIKIIIKIKN